MGKEQCRGKECGVRLRSSSPACSSGRLWLGSVYSIPNIEHCAPYRKGLQSSIKRISLDLTRQAFEYGCITLHSRPRAKNGRGAVASYMYEAAQRVSSGLMFCCQTGKFISPRKSDGRDALQCWSHWLREKKVNAARARASVPTRMVG